MPTPLARALSGALFGGALLALAVAVTPRPAAAQTGFCSETENYICCCSLNADGSINTCACQSKASIPRPQ